jgi:hypothetical protein
MNTTEPVQVNTHETILVLDDDLMMIDGLVARLERSGRTLITCNDVESAELIVDWLKPSHSPVSSHSLMSPLSRTG